MRISDWSSDVCSSDLRRSPRPRELPLRAAGAVYPPRGPDFPEARVCAAWGAVTRRTVSSGCHPREGGDPWDELAPAPPMDPGTPERVGSLARDDSRRDRKTKWYPRLSPLRLCHEVPPAAITR